MNSANEISIKKLRQDLHQALKDWYKDGSLTGSLDYLYLVQQTQGANIRQATNKVIIEALKALDIKHPKGTELLRKRFIDRQLVLKVANQLNLSKSMVYKRQREAIESLANVLLEMEEEATAERQQIFSEKEEKAAAERQKRLEEGLLQPSYLNLIGVSSSLKRLREILITPQPPWIVSLEGIGGIGKTSLADALVRQMVGQGEYQNFGWVSARQQHLNLGGSLKVIEKPVLTEAALVEALVTQLLGLPSAQLSGEQALLACRHRLGEHPHLLVIDNLETMLDVETLLPTLRRLVNPSKILLTSRESLYAEADIYHFVVPELSSANALQLVREEARQRYLPHLALAQDDDLLPIYEVVGGNPLALRLLVGQTHLHPLHVILSDLAQAQGQTVENLYTFIYRHAWDNLDDVTRQVFSIMPLATTKGSALEFLGVLSGLEISQLRHALDLLVRLNLVELRGKLGDRRYTIHNLTRSFLEKQIVKWQ